MQCVNRFTIKNDMRELERLHQWLEEMKELCKFSEALYRSVQLACDEWVTNVISYAFPDGGEHRIVIFLEWDGHRCKILVKDDGVAYNPLEREEVDVELSLEERPIGGLGIHLIKSMIDELHYERCDQHNRLTMIKYEGVLKDGNGCYKAR